MYVYNKIYFLSLFALLFCSFFSPLREKVEGVQFMYDNLVVNTAQLRGGGDEAEGNGCILAHCMGLGKTLQVIDEIPNFHPCCH